MFSSSDVNTYTARFGLQKPCCMTLRLKAQMEIKFAKYVPSIIFIKILPFSKHYDGYSSKEHRILSIWNYHYLGKVNWNDGLGLKCIFWRDKTFCHLRLNLMKYIKCAYSCPSLDIYLVILKMQTSQVLRYISLIQMDCMIACDQYHWCFFQNLGIFMNFAQLDWISLYLFIKEFIYFIFYTNETIGLQLNFDRGCLEFMYVTLLTWPSPSLTWLGRTKLRNKCWQRSSGASISKNISMNSLNPA